MERRKNSEGILRHFYEIIFDVGDCIFEGLQTQGKLKPDIGNVLVVFIVKDTMRPLVLKRVYTNEITRGDLRGDVWHPH